MKLISVAVPLRTFGAVVVCCLAALPLFAQSAPTCDLTVKIAGAKNAKGKLGVGVFKDATGFPEDDSRMVARETLEIDPQKLTAEVVFGDLPCGVYAVSVRHDENVNGKLDKNFVGIPKEGYGISNNPKPKMRPPGFDEARLELSAPGQTVEIHLVYR